MPPLSIHSLAKRVKRIFAPIGIWLASTSLAVAAPALSIGVSVSDLGNPYFVTIANGAKERAQALAGGNAKVSVVSSAYDIGRQVDQIDQFIAQGVDFILLIASDYEALYDAVLRAKAAGIYVIAVDVKAKGANATVTTANTQAGEIACEYLAKSLNYQGNVVIINGPPVSSVLARVKGCLTVFAQYPNLTVLSTDRNAGGSREGGLETMTYLATKFPKIDGAFTINDPTAIGVEQAARIANRTELKIVSVDGALVARERLGEPNSLIIGTASQFPTRMAETAVDIGYNLMQGNAAPATPVLIPSELISAENKNDYTSW